MRSLTKLLIVAFGLLAGCRRPAPVSNLLTLPETRVRRDTSEAKRLLALIPIELRLSDSSPNPEGLRRYAALTDIFSKLPPPGPPGESRLGDDLLTRLSDFSESISPLQTDQIRAILRSGPVAVPVEPSGPDRVRQFMPAPIWRAAIEEARSGKLDASIDDLALAVRYCRSVTQQPNSIQRAWLMTMASIRACLDGRKLDRKAARLLLAELPSVAWVRDQVVEEIKARLVQDTLLIANMQAPIQGETIADAEGPPIPIPPFGNLDRTSTVQMMIKLASGDIANAEAPKAKFSLENELLRRKLKGDLPELRTDSDDSASDGMQAGVEAFAEEMNRAPNSLGRARLRAMGSMDFGAIWLFEDELEKLRRDLAKS